MGKVERSTHRQQGKAPRRRSAPAVLPKPLPEQSVLIVESDPDLQAQTARLLRKQGYRVVASGSGSGALALVSAWDVSLILVSESLPGRSGIDVVRELLRTRPSARILMVTTDPEPRFRAAARSAGALGCVVKPLSADSLAPWLELSTTRVAAAPLARTLVHPSALPLTNSALPVRGAVAE
jgi:DNA-binding response OmpR family regulator